ncbi:MAG: aspartate kinase [candidate division KSB1 bacterium]|nr:aspartate kinase [candidate division KSB1 bacterium]
MPENSRPLIVQKYGGSSLATPDHVRRVARHVIERKSQGCDLVVVVSAMGKTTDQFVKLAHELNPNPDRRELDMLLASGEQISIAALALAVRALGPYQAVSLTGPQAGILTDNHHSHARIIEIFTDRIRKLLSEDKIVIVAGFQGVTIDDEITTLGRGGSDTTAVALAAALKADYCEIMSDIDGIYTADPKLVPSAKRIDRIHYDLALELAASGAKMLQKTSVEFAKRHGIPLSLGSSMSGQIGTIVGEASLGKGRVAGVSADNDLAVVRFALSESEAMKLPAEFSRQRIHLKLWQCVQGLGLIGISRGDVNLVRRILLEKTTDVFVEEEWALVAVVGDGIGVGTTAAQRFFAILEELAVPVAALVSGELYLKVLCPAARSKIILEELHNKLVLA